ncbi:CLUMA_CG021143, isoform A [Clunio marinus]|uniref:CLUMA_CG021143, isoform A n=1 Tax=Clunio marinus TaxID=568069 RepID=A0A1J1JAA1_9DIPT|nr:CLUMA_CG021143, isoform A [Clunio marinus]
MPANTCVPKLKANVYFHLIFAPYCFNDDFSSLRYLEDELLNVSITPKQGKILSLMLNWSNLYYQPFLNREYAFTLITSTKVLILTFSKLNEFTYLDLMLLKKPFVLSLICEENTTPDVNKKNVPNFFSTFLRQRQATRRRTSSGVRKEKSISETSSGTLLIDLNLKDREIDRNDLKFLPFGS